MIYEGMNQEANDVITDVRSAMMDTNEILSTKKNAVTTMQGLWPAGQQLWH
jgi:hypothetical protein